MRDVLRHILHLPEKAWKAIAAEEKAAMLGLIEWMMPAPQCADIPFWSFEHRGITYYLPKAHFENGTCLEFALASDYYDKFRETQAPEDLLLIVATLCRPANPDAKAAELIGDVRAPLTDRAQVEARAQSIKDLPMEYAVWVLYYFTGVKLLIRDTYHDLFDEATPAPEEDEDDEQPKAEENQADGPRFGWWSTFIQVAKTGVLGDYNTLIQRRMHLLCMTLMEQHDEAEKIRAIQERGRSKFNNDDDL
jgi:hypothetical protein